VLPREIGIAVSFHGEHLQPSAVGETLSAHWVLRRAVPVEAGREGEVVLNKVERLRAVVPGRGLVREPSRPADGRPRALARGRHVEDVAVPLGEAGVRCAREVGPDVGPLTVSSQVIQLPQGMGPPEQFICVPLRLTPLRDTLP
jgi:hypothetical protein